MAIPTYRAGEIDDLPALTEIYNYYVVNTPTTFDLEPYSVAQRQNWFDHYHESGPYRLIVMLDGSKTIGYASSSQFRSKAAYDTSVETTIYLAPEWTGLGLGAKLYQMLLNELASEPVHRCYGGIALPNEASVTMHKELGYTLVGTFREVGFKFGKYWDVQWYEKTMP